MRIPILLFLIFFIPPVYGQTQMQFAEIFLKSIREKNFELLKPFHDTRNTRLKQKWQGVVENAYREGFDLDQVKIVSVVEGQKIPDLPLKAIIILYKYKDQEWDDLLLLITTDKKFIFMEIPLDSEVFMLNENRRGRNLEDAKKIAK